MHDFFLTLRSRRPHDPEFDPSLRPQGVAWPSQFVVGPFCAELDLGTAQWTASPQGLLIALKGHLYSHQLSELPELYLKHGDHVADQLEGSFSLLLLDVQRGQVKVLTDRVGSVKVYLAREDTRQHLSSSLSHPELHRRPYSPAGLACALLNGSLLGGLTLFEGVQALEAASVITLEAGGPRSQRYWPHREADQPARGRPDDHLAELSELLWQATLRRVAVAGDRTLLSLSGGYDSRGLLSLLARTGRPFESFSYTLATPVTGSDASTAQRLARQYGVHHRVLSAYRGDLRATLRRNAVWGQGDTHFCDEADAWAELATGEPSDLFVGDEMFEWNIDPVPSTTDLLRRVHISEFGALGWLSGLLPEGTFSRLRDAWQAEQERLLQGVQTWPQRDHPVIALGYQQFLPHHLLPWRARFAGHTARVHTPYLDGAVLDFFQRVPLNLFQHKTVFRAALRQMDPGLFQVPLARSLGYAADWTGELIRQRAALVEALAQPCRLDEWIEPTLLNRLLDGLMSGDGYSVKRQLRETLGRWRYSPLGRALFGQPSARTSLVSPTTFLLRALTLRELELSRATVAEPVAG